MTIVRTKPVGHHEGYLAPDETWRLRSDWPEANVMVEICYAGLLEKRGQFGFGVGCIVSFDDYWNSTWQNSRRETLVFNPEFWRPLSDQKQQLLRKRQVLRDIAYRIGSMHSYWEVISDIDDLCAERPARMTFEEIMAVTVVDEPARGIDNESL